MPQRICSCAVGGLLWYNAAASLVPLNCLAHVRYPEEAFTRYVQGPLRKELARSISDTQVRPGYLLLLGKIGKSFAT